MRSSPAHRASRTRRRWLAALALGLAGCGERRSEAPVEAQAPLAIQVYADTAHGPSPGAPPPPAVSVWLERVGPVRPAALDLPPPDAPPDTVIPESPPSPAIETGLTPPVLIAAVPLVTPRDPRGAHARGSIEIDLEVDDNGRVTQTVWAGGSADTALVRAAIECARSMRFRPARRGGQPIAVWCRQRFDFGARERR
jgi:periplasmic protein TonB